MQFDTKIAIVIRHDLEVWQKLNVAAFLASGIAAAFPTCIGEPYADGSGTPYVLAASSLFEHPETSISTAKLLDIAAGSEAARSLIFLDACRESVTTGARAVDADSETAAPLIEGMSHVDGQVVFYAAAAGKYAYDDDEKQNGVFTTAVIEGLRCQAATDERGLITVETLAAYVESCQAKIATDPANTQGGRPRARRQANERRISQRAADERIRAPYSAYAVVCAAKIER